MFVNQANTLSTERIFFLATHSDTDSPLQFLRGFIHLICNLCMVAFNTLNLFLKMLHIMKPLKNLTILLRNRFS